MQKDGTILEKVSPINTWVDDQWYRITVNFYDNNTKVDIKYENRDAGTVYY